MSRETLLSNRCASLAELEARILKTDLGDTPASMREGFDTIMAGQIEGEPGEIGGVSGLFVGRGPLKAIWFHGGGYVFGSAQSHTFAARWVAGAAQGRIFLPDYRLAPEHVWPAPLVDAKRVLKACETPIAVIGDSAGGHLALNLALERPEDVAALVLFSPNTDRTGQSDTRRRKSDDDIMNDDATDRKLFDIACPDTPATSVSASPVRADLGSLPRTYLAVGGDEVLLDDSLMLAREAALCGVRVQLDVLPGLWHMFWQWPDILPLSQLALTRAANFIRS